MRRWMAVWLVVAGLLGAKGISAQQPDVEYVNGTVKGLTEGAMGMVDMTSAEALEFHVGAGQFSIPYAEIRRVKCREENRFRLGVLATIGVSLVKARSKRHLVTIEWKPADGPPGVVTLDASKEKARGLATVLRARAPHACPSVPGQGCGFAD